MQPILTDGSRVKIEPPLSLNELHLRNREVGGDAVGAAVGLEELADGFWWAVTAKLRRLILRT